MTKKINSNQFSFSFFLSNRKKVESLESGAIENGGATYNKNTNELYSNIAGSDFIELNDNNKLSIFIPDTININEKTDNLKYAEYIANQIRNRYNNVNDIEYGLGSWYSDDLQKIVYDNITIASVNLATVTKKDIQFFIKLAEYIKREMAQEAVTITINNALCLI